MGQAFDKCYAWIIRYYYYLHFTNGKTDVLSRLNNFPKFTKLVGSLILELCSYPLCEFLFFPLYQLILVTFPIIVLYPENNLAV